MLALLKVLEDCKLSNNRVARVEYVQMLVAECGALRTLDLRGCPVRHQVPGQLLTVRPEMLHGSPPEVLGWQHSKQIPDCISTNFVCCVVSEVFPTK